MKIWVKLYKGEDIISGVMIEKPQPFDRAVFDASIKEAVDFFDLSTPVILSHHYIHFRDFNMVKFLPRDFVESVDFDKMTAENASD